MYAVNGHGHNLLDQYNAGQYGAPQINMMHGYPQAPYIPPMQSPTIHVKPHTHEHPQIAAKQPVNQVPQASAAPLPKTTATKKASTAPTKSKNKKSGSVGNIAKSDVRQKKQISLIDFSKLDATVLKRYKRHFNLKLRKGATKNDLASTISKHFAAQAVAEIPTIAYFAYAVRNQDNLLKIQPPASNRG